MKKKLAATLITSLFATVALAQASSTAATTTSNSSATNVGLAQQHAAPGSATTRSTTHRVVHGSKRKVSHHAKKPVVLDKSKLDGKSSLQ
ncbi:hypothetical protein [Burkholderia thailandensis]|uniref:hypothetical protein n=1 Tax=Burkholderia thailandensis TaxID=57975 RepID=UPI0003ECA568|nr:hypothetical protein [Burkholderia thailandensis]AHI65468.1 hypothetical protein BTL_39 [Burkholderia thailandensis H0587]